MSLAGCFAKVLRNGFLVKTSSSCGHVIHRSSSLWEPDYLILGKTKTPEYDLLNIQIKGYDYAILEKYQKYIKGIAMKMQIYVGKTWAAPQQDLAVHHYKRNSTDILYEYRLKLSERNVQVVDVKSPIMSLFIEFIVTACPPGVKVSIHEHEDAMEEDRYIPNYEILELQEELEEVGSDVKKKKKQSSLKVKTSIKA